MEIRAFLLAAVGSTILWTAAAGAVQICPDCLHFTHTWPTDGAPCDAGSTLQQCIDSASSGDTVQIATNAVIQESPTFQKSLTLQAAPGFHPLFAASQSIHAVSPMTGSTSITVQGLTLADGFIRVSQYITGAGPMTVQILGNTVHSNGDAIAVLGAVSGGAVAIDVSNNVVTVSAPDASVAGISAALNGSGRIANNVISMEDSPGATAISIGDQTSLSIDLIANQISGPGRYDAGISIGLNSAGTTEARILDNLVVGQSGSEGQGAIALFSLTGGALSATVENNTLADDALGLTTHVDTSGATLTGLVANNVISGSTVGLSIDPASSLANRNNLVFGNGSDSFSPGPGTISADPQFVGAGNDRLKPGSPAIDAGDDTDVPSDLATDVDGNPRTQGRHVDIGAYEAPAPSLLGAPRSFTGELQVEIGGGPLHSTLSGHGNAVLNTSVAPPSFTIPAGAFVAVSDFLSDFSKTTRNLVTLTGQNAQGSFDAQVHQMPFSGLLKFKRLAYPPIVGTAAGSIDASHIGASGKATAAFHYVIQTLVFTHGVLTFTPKTLDGTAKLTGQSFTVTKDSRTAAGGGHIQMVAPFSFASSLNTWTGPASVSLAIDFAPEPDHLAVGAAAVAVLCAIGLAKRRRA